MEPTVFLGNPESLKDEILGRLIGRRSFLKALKPSVIWLSFQECTGCTESLLRTAHPGLDELILDLISLDYHEALMVPSGHLAEEARIAAMNRHDGQVRARRRGRHPHRRRAASTARSVAAPPSTWSPRPPSGPGRSSPSAPAPPGAASRPPTPTPPAPRGRAEVLAGKTVVTIPGCPANPYNFLGTVLQYATFGTLPALDDKGRPMFAYGRTIHEHCPRRPHFDAGRFAERSATRGTASATASTSSAARGRRPTPTARPSTSARSAAPGRSASATPASAAPSRSWPSASPSTTPCRSTARPRPTPTPDRRRARPGEPVGGRRGRGHRRRRWSAPAWRRARSSGAPKAAVPPAAAPAEEE
jgi:hypothetical protein